MTANFLGDRYTAIFSAFLHMETVFGVGGVPLLPQRLNTFPARGLL